MIVRSDFGSPLDVPCVYFCREREKERRAGEQQREETEPRTDRQKRR